MAGGCDMKILAKCSCGEILIQEFQNIFWTLLPCLVEKSRSMELEEVLCPNCGGDPSIKIGSFYHKRYYQNGGWWLKSNEDR
jgi:hypothetical protein